MYGEFRRALGTAETEAIKRRQAPPGTHKPPPGTMFVLRTAAVLATGLACAEAFSAPTPAAALRPAVRSLPMAPTAPSLRPLLASKRGSKKILDEFGGTSDVARRSGACQRTQRL